jgi:hypothetical protein
VIRKRKRQTGDGEEQDTGKQATGKSKIQSRVRERQVTEKSNKQASD